MSTTVDLSDRSRELLAGKVPFVEATVVRAQVPASVRPGDGAIVLPDGSIEGFVGGQCAQGSVRAAALAAIRDGHSVLLRVLPEEGEPFPEAPGAHVVVNPCLSGGALEIFLQPRLPDPVIGVVGDSPIVAALRELAPPLGFVVESATVPGTVVPGSTVPESEGPESEGPESEGPESGVPTVVAHSTAVVLASHGGDEASFIRAALDAGVGFVGLVASRRRGAAVLADLDLTEEERARVHTPAGLDIGASTAPEIALSILAEVTRAIRKEGLGPPEAAVPAQRSAPEAPGSAVASVEPSPPATAVDPVCGMTVTVGPTTPHLAVDGREYWFCGPGCRDGFGNEG